MKTLRDLGIGIGCLILLGLLFPVVKKAVGPVPVVWDSEDENEGDGA